MILNFPTSLVLETPRLRLRLPSAEDIPHVFSATHFPGFNDGMLWEPPKHIDELWPHLQNNLVAWEEGSAFGFSIDDRDSGQFLGRISIRKTEEKDLWDIGFWTHPERQGRGIMTEAVQAILEFGFTQLAATRIEACHALWNKASEKVLQNNGLQFVRYIEKGFQKKGKWVEENLLAINQNEWKSFKEMTSG